MIIMKNIAGNTPVITTHQPFSEKGEQFEISSQHFRKTFSPFSQVKRGRHLSACTLLLLTSCTTTGTKPEISPPYRDFQQFHEFGHHGF